MQKLEFVSEKLNPMTDPPLVKLFIYVFERRAKPLNKRYIGFIIMTT